MCICQTLWMVLRLIVWEFNNVFMVGVPLQYPAAVKD